MPERTSKPKRPRDLNELAAAIVGEAVGESGAPADAPTEPEKNPHAAALGRLGGIRGGRARAEKLTPQQRREISKKAATARWATKKLVE